MNTEPVSGCACAAPGSIASAIHALEAPAFALEPAGPITLWNPALQAHSGLPAQQVIGRPLWEFAPELRRLFPAAVLPEHERDLTPWVDQALPGIPFFASSAHWLNWIHTRRASQPGGLAWAVLPGEGGQGFWLAAVASLAAAGRATPRFQHPLAVHLDLLPVPAVIANEGLDELLAANAAYWELVGPPGTIPKLPLTFGATERAVLRSSLADGQRAAVPACLRAAAGHVRRVSVSASVLPHPPGSAVLLVFTPGAAQLEPAASEQNERIERLEVMRKLVEATLQTTSLAELAHTVLRNISAILPYDYGVILLDHGPTQPVEVLGRTPDPATLPRAAQPVVPCPHAAFRVEQAGPATTPALKLALEKIRANWEAAGARASLYLPVLDGEEVIGAVELASRCACKFHPSHHQLLRGIAGMIAAAIQHHRLEENHRQRTRQLEVITLLSGTLRTAETRTEMVNILLQYCKDLLDADAGCLLLLRDGLVDLFGGIGQIESPLSLLKHRPGNPMWGEMEAGRALFVDDGETQLDPRSPLGRLALKSRLGSLAVLPLRARASLIGVLIVGYQEPHAITAHRRSLLQAIAELSGIALHRAGATEQLQERVVDRTHELSAIYNVILIASEATALEPVLRSSLEMTCTAIRAQAGAVYLRSRSSLSLSLAAVVGIDSSAQAAGVDDIVRAHVWPALCENPEPLLAPNLAQDAGATALDPLRAYLAVPITRPDGPAGVLVLLRHQEGPFSPEEISLLAAVANQLGGAVERVELRRIAEEAAVTSERSRLARELHDSVTQALYSVNLLARSSQDSLHDQEYNDLEETLGLLEYSASHALREMRLLLYELQPTPLGEGGLAEAISQRLQAVEQRAGIQAELRAAALPPLPPVMEQDLYRITMEALNNALKHARASEVTVTLETAGRQIALRVEDNGIGFVPRQANSGGYGLISMRERAVRLGGELEIDSLPGRGTKVGVWVPLPEGRVR